MSFLVADLHAHPTMKTFLLPWPFRKRFDRPHRAGGAFNPIGMRCDLPSLLAGGVRVLVSAVYVPERGLLDQCWVLRGISHVARRLRRMAYDDPLATTLRCLAHFEQEVARAPDAAEVARSPEQLDRILGDGRLAVLHSVEGAHSLAGNSANVDVLHARGVCMLTLAHFFDNGVAPPVNGIPDDFFLRRAGCFRGDPDATLPLPPLGREVVERMLARGMAIDLTHTTPPARAEVLALARGKRPVLMSHVGARALADYPMNPSADEVRAIADDGGIVGVICMGYWLARPRRPDTLDPVLDTIEALRNAGGDDCVALGSDFDGMTDPPDDLKEPSDFPWLARRLADRFGEGRARRYLGGNALRFLRTAWTR